MYQFKATIMIKLTEIEVTVISLVKFGCFHFLNCFLFTLDKNGTLSRFSTFVFEFHCGGNVAIGLPLPATLDFLTLTELTLLRALPMVDDALYFLRIMPGYDLVSSLLRVCMSLYARAFLSKIRRLCIIVLFGRAGFIVFPKLVLILEEEPSFVLPRV